MYLENMLNYQTKLCRLPQPWLHGCCRLKYLAKTNNPFAMYVHMYTKPYVSQLIIIQSGTAAVAVCFLSIAISC